MGVSGGGKCKKAEGIRRVRRLRGMREEMTTRWE
jgi:hypothetical protein